MKPHLSLAVLLSMIVSLSQPVFKRMGLPSRLSALPIMSPGRFI